MSNDERDQSEEGAPDGGAHRAEDFRQLFQKGIRFTEELLDENERLRFRVAALEASEKVAAAPALDAPPETIVALQRRVAELETERARLVASFHEVELLNLDFKSRYAEIEEEHNNLANLYIASYQLHATMGFRDIVQVVAEIVINLVGVQRFAIYFADDQTRTLVPLFAEGQDVSDLTPVRLGEGPIGEAVSRGAVSARDGDAKGDGPLAVIPLSVSGVLVGAIVLDELLVQKESFSRMDMELFQLLGGHAAFALLAGELFDAARGKGGAKPLDVERVRALIEGAHAGEGA